MRKLAYVVLAIVALAALAVSTMISVGPDLSRHTKQSPNLGEQAPATASPGTGAGADDADAKPAAPPPPPSQPGSSTEIVPSVDGSLGDAPKASDEEVGASRGLPASPESAPYPPEGRPYPNVYEPSTPEANIPTFPPSDVPAGGGASPDLSKPAAPSTTAAPSGAPPASDAPPSDAPSSSDSAAGGVPPTPAPAAPPATGDAAAPPADWDLVPVYYGTDRAAEPNANRLDYGSGRGRRLELGRALVTIPKAHITPAIERPWAIRVPYLNVTLYEETEDPKSHFTMQEIKALKEEDFLTLVRERLALSARFKDHAFIFVHGYNTSFDYAIYRTAQIAYDLKFDGAAFSYSWPSGGGLASYTYDRESSGQAEPYLKQFIELVSQKSGAKSVSIIAHSMGNQPTLQVLRDLKRQSPGGVRISQIILAAPDVDRDNFENIAAEIQGVANGVTLYAAANDRALHVSRNFYGGVPRAGDVPATGPLVLPGMDTVDATAASMDSLGLNHSGYAENNALLSDIGLLIQSGERPPSIRTPILERIQTDKGPYWRYPLAH
ncbi:MAG: alpha/beta hydrolase [Hyphomicrobium sp.]|jgi:esterase/lipase superfamily enzyme